MKLDYFLDHDIYAGLTGIDLNSPDVDFGGGARIRQTYAHLMAPFMVAFQRAKPGQAHPAPWKAALGGAGFDITAELYIPVSCETGSAHRVDVARTIVALMRMRVVPSVTIPVFSNVSFSAAATAADDATHFFPFEVQPRFFPIDSSRGKTVEISQLEWVKVHWREAVSLAAGNEALALAISALDAVQFVSNPGLGLISLWGGLEALFSSARMELKFRLSALIASYLEPFGASRAALQKEVASLYDARSKAAHGGSRHDPKIVLKTYDLLRRILIKMIDNGHVPSRTELETNLFG